MLKRISLFLIAVFLMVNFAHAANPAVEGTVQKIDKKSITLQIGSDQKVFTFGKFLRISVKGKHPKEYQIKAGDKATVYADKKNVTQKIDITPQSGSGSGSSN